MTAAGLNLSWRELAETDRSFVLHSWLRSYQEHGSEFKGMLPAAYYVMYEPVVKRMLDASTVRVASDRDIPDTVIGYTVTQGSTLHYFLVHPRFRRFGVARWMLRGMPDGIAAYTHRPGALASKLMDPTWAYNATDRPFEANHG